jgi:hypothetical protein
MTNLFKAVPSCADCGTKRREDHVDRRPGMVSQPSNEVAVRRTDVWLCDACARARMDRQELGQGFSPV